MEQCKVVTDRMAELTREAIFDAIGLFDGGAYTPEMADRIEALETKIDEAVLSQLMEEVDET